MATGTRKRRAPHPDVTVLHGMPYKVYARLTALADNRHLRMSYHDGTLEIVSPHLLEHEEPSLRIRVILVAVAKALGVPYHGTDSFTFRRAGVGIYKGNGKEPDKSFYFANAGRVPRDRNLSLDAGDPPPDLWIEVDNRSSSLGRLPIYAALGVPEVWRYRAKRKTITFLQLVDGVYQPIARSLSLPVLTPNLIQEALYLGGNLLEYEWEPLLQIWVAQKFGPQTGGI